MQEKDTNLGRMRHMDKVVLVLMMLVMTLHVVVLVDVVVVHCDHLRIIVGIGEDNNERGATVVTMVSKKKGRSSVWLTVGRSRGSKVRPDTTHPQTHNLPGIVCPKPRMMVHGSPPCTTHCMV